jgi:hypothetical protein
MERLNSTGIPRQHLLFALKDARTVNAARRIDSCLLCRRNGVNDAALCHVCWALLNEDELKQGERWLTGVGP